MQVTNGGEALRKEGGGKVCDDVWVEGVKGGVGVQEEERFGVAGFGVSGKDGNKWTRVRFWV